MSHRTNSNGVRIDLTPLRWADTSPEKIAKVVAHVIERFSVVELRVSRRELIAYTVSMGDVDLNAHAIKLREEIDAILRA